MNPLIKEALENAVDTVPELKPLEEQRYPAPPLTREMLPETIAKLVGDVANRIQCPPDFVAVAALSTLAVLIGRKRVLAPKTRDNWIIVPTLWAAVIGGPSSMKSPAIKAVMKPVDELEGELKEIADQENKRREWIAELNKNIIKEQQKLAQVKFEEGKTEEALAIMAEAEESEEPLLATRLIANDATVPKLVEILEQNPNGLLMLRDELSGFISKLNSEEAQSDRAFYLECYDGDGSYTTDRIARGTNRVDHCVLSIIGGIQPSKLEATLSAAISGKADDGLIQRFQLAVYPDPKPKRKWRDKEPDSKVMDDYRALLKKLLYLEVESEEERILRFSEDAQAAFAVWWEALQDEISNPDTPQIIQSHFGKMPKTIGTLATLFHLCESDGHSISLETLTKALEWWPYLKAHAFRLYGIVDSASMSGAKRLFGKRHLLKDGFTARDVYRKGWTALKDTEQVNLALNILVEHGYLIELPPSRTGTGRPT